MHNLISPLCGSPFIGHGIIEKSDLCFLGIRAIEWKTNDESFADMTDKDDDKGIRVYLQSQHGEVSSHKIELI